MRRLLGCKTVSPSVMITGLLIVSGMFTSFVACARGGQDPADRQEIVRELPGKARLVIEVISADCIIETGSQDLIQLRILHTHEEDRYQVEVRERSAELQLRERFLGGSTRGISNWQLTVPAATEVLFSSASGELESRGDYAGLEADSASGAISVRDLNGRIDINTASSPIRLWDLAGELQVNTVSGEVELAGFDGRLELRTVSGDLELEGLGAEIEAVTAAGRIAASELRPTGECSFSSAAGDIEVQLAETPLFDLSLTSAAGKVELDLNGNAIAGTYEFSALEYAGRIESPIGFDQQEIFVHAGQTYLRNSFSRGSALPRITLATAAGSVRLKQ